MSAHDVTPLRAGPGGAKHAAIDRAHVGLVSARLAGGLYVLIIVLGVFAEVVVRSRLVSDDAQVTADNIRDSEWLFRAGFAADLVVFLADVAVAVILYFLFRPVSRPVSLLSAAFRLTQTAIVGLNLLNMFGALLILDDADYVRAFGESETGALASLFLEFHRYGYILGLTFFGVSTLLLGYLALMSGRMPRALGVLLGLAGLGYIVDSVTFFLVPGYDGAVSPIVLAPALIGEVWFALWLLFRGRKLEALGDGPRVSIPAR